MPLAVVNRGFVSLGSGSAIGASARAFSRNILWSEALAGTHLKMVIASWVV